MVNDSMDLLELLRKSGVDGDVWTSSGGAQGADGCDHGRRGLSEDRR